MRQYSEDISIRFTPAQRKAVERVAHERSEPGETVAISHVIRDALAEHLDDDEFVTQHEEEVEA